MPLPNTKRLRACKDRFRGETPTPLPKLTGHLSVHWNPHIFFPQVHKFGSLHLGSPGCWRAPGFSGAGARPGSAVACGLAYTDCHQAARALGAQGLLLAREKKNRGSRCTWCSAAVPRQPPVGSQRPHWEDGFCNGSIAV